MSLDRGTIGGFQIVRVLQVQPVLGRGAEVARQPYGGINRNSSLAIYNRADPVHRNPQRTREFVQAHVDLLKFVPEQLARMYGRQLLSLCHRFNKAATIQLRELTNTHEHSVVVHDLNVVSIPIMPRKAETPTVIDPYAVLALAIALKRLQSISPDCAKVRQTHRRVQPSKPRAGLIFDDSEPPARITLMKCPGFFAADLSGSLKRGLLETRSVTESLDSYGAQNSMPSTYMPTLP